MKSICFAAMLAAAVSAEGHEEVWQVASFDGTKLEDIALTSGTYEYKVGKDESGAEFINI